jgi:hypothetical protein
MPRCGWGQHSRGARTIRQSVDVAQQAGKRPRLNSAVIEKTHHTRQCHLDGISINLDQIMTSRNPLLAYVLELGDPLAQYPQRRELVQFGADLLAKICAVTQVSVIALP